MPNGTVVVVTPPTNSVSAEINSYQVQFTGPGQMFTSELWVTKLISGTLERVCNADGTWSERVFFTTSVIGAVETPVGGGAVGTPGVVFVPAEAFVGDVPPGNPVVGDLWWDSTGGELYVFYDDGTSKQWVNTRSQ